MRIDIRFGNDDTVATVLNNIPRADRPTALRVLIRKHVGELAGIAGLAQQAASTTSAVPPPAAFARAVPDPAPIMGAAPGPAAESAERASLARSLVRMGARHGAHAIACLAVAGLLAFVLPTQQARAGTLDLNYNVSSIHTEAWARRALKQTNPGAGITYHFDRDWALMGGEYLNSYRRPTWYVLAAFTPLHIGSVDRWHLEAGVVAGLATGYTRRENAYAPSVAGALVRVVAPNGVALNVLAVPNQGPRNSGFIGFQLAFPIR